MKYFQPHEFACKCGCGRGYNEMSAELLERLDEARERAGIPFVLSSAFRCPAHNRAVGGVSDSAHTKGMAVDIVCRNSQTRFAILKALLDAGFHRIELAPTWLHVDVDPDKTQDVAFYQPGGQYR